MKRHLCDHHLQVQDIPLPAKDTRSPCAVIPPRSPNPWQPPSCLLCLWLCWLWTCHVDGITHGVALRPAALSTMFSRSTHLVAWVRASCLSMAEHDSARGRAIVRMYPYFDGHWSSFYFLAVTGSAAVNILTLSYTSEPTAATIIKTSTPTFPPGKDLAGAPPHLKRHPGGAHSCLRRDQRRVTCPDTRSGCFHGETQSLSGHKSLGVDSYLGPRDRPQMWQSPSPSPTSWRPWN